MKLPTTNNPIYYHYFAATNGVHHVIARVDPSTDEIRYLLTLPRLGASNRIVAEVEHWVQDANAADFYNLRCQKTVLAQRLQRLREVKATVPLPEWVPDTSI